MGGGLGPGFAAGDLAGSIQRSLEDSVRFRRETAEFLKHAFPDKKFEVPVEPAWAMKDVYVGTERQPGAPPPSPSAPPPISREALHEDPGKLPEVGRPRRRAPSKVEGAVSGVALRTLGGAAAGEANGPTDAEADAFSRYLSRHMADGSAERLRKYEEMVADNRWWEGHVTENHWNVRDDERFMEDRADRERDRDHDAGYDSRVRDRQAEERADERRRAEEDAERMRWEAESERRNLERERTYRDDNYRSPDE
jgi:hypothetical protein